MFQGRGELIDHILVSGALLPRGADDDRIVPVVDSVVDLTDGGLPSIDPGRAAESGRESVPDHAPVVATFDI